jgi:hypothetical protein
MIDPGLEQEAERVHARLIWLVGLGGLAVTALLVAIAWLLIVSPAATERPAVTPSPREPGRSGSTWTTRSRGARLAIRRLDEDHRSAASASLLGVMSKPTALTPSSSRSMRKS